VGIRLFAVGFAIVSLVWVVQRFRRTRRFTVELVAWLVCFSGVGLVVFVPHATDTFAGWLGVSSGFNALTFITITMLLVFVFRILTRLQKVERDLTQLIRANAIDMAVHVRPRPADPPSADQART
jgi:hypothetical protein